MLHHYRGMALAHIKTETPSTFFFFLFFCLVYSFFASTSALLLLCHYKKPVLSSSGPSIYRRDRSCPPCSGKRCHRYSCITTLSLVCLATGESCPLHPCICPRVSLFPPALLPTPLSNTPRSPTPLLWPATAPDGDHAAPRYVVGAGSDRFYYIVVGHFRRV